MCPWLSEFADPIFHCFGGGYVTTGRKYLARSSFDQAQPHGPRCSTKTDDVRRTSVRVRILTEANGASTTPRVRIVVAPIEQQRWGRRWRGIPLGVHDHSIRSCLSDICHGHLVATRAIVLQQKGPGGIAIDSAIACHRSAFVIGGSACQLLTSHGSRLTLAFRQCAPIDFIERVSASLPTVAQVRSSSSCSWFL